MDQFHHGSPRNCFANAAVLDPSKGIFVGMARFALGSSVSLDLTNTRIHASGEKNTGFFLEHARKGQSRRARGGRPGAGREGVV